MTPEEKKIFAQEALLALVLQRFPKAGARLPHLFRGSPSFQTLCEDYRDCLAALQHWQQATSEKAPELYQSYAELLKELEQEIWQYLEDEWASRTNLKCQSRQLI